MSSGYFTALLAHWKTRLTAAADLAAEQRMRAPEAELAREELNLPDVLQAAPLRIGRRQRRNIIQRLR